MANRNLDLMLDEHLELLGTPDELADLVDILVRGCGCGCVFRAGELVSPTPRCAAVRALRERRFVVGMLFARRLRRQLEAEEWARTPWPPPPSS